MSDERLKMWLSFWKTVIVSGAVATVGIIVPPWINAEIQNKKLDVAKARNTSQLEITRAEKDAEIEIKRLAQEKEYITAFLDPATVESVEDRYRFTRYLSALSTNPQMKLGWSTLFEDAKAEKEKTQARIKALEGQEDEKSQAEIARLKEELEVSRKTRDTISVDNVPLNKLNENAKCPEETSPMVTARDSGLVVESSNMGRLKATMPGVPAEASIEFKGLAGRLLFQGNTRIKYFNIVIACLDKEGKTIASIPIRQISNQDALIRAQ